MRLVRLAIVLPALLVAFVPLPGRLVEAWYSRGVYPSIQAAITPLTNRAPTAVLDVAIIVLLVALAFLFWRRVRAGGVARALVRSALSLVTLGAVGYLAFLALWGLNYRRVALETRLDFDQARVTREAARRLGEHAVQTVNGEYASAHAAQQQGPSLESAFASAQQLLGSSRLAVPGVPKRSLLGFYFRAAAIDGMTDPFFLEVILNPDTLPFERPFVIAHEWAHLAGYAHEAEANLVAWLTCTQGDALARYSGWLAIYDHTAASLPKVDRSALAVMLDPGPRRDLDEVARRYRQSSPLVRDAARDLYDTYLRANRVEEGIASYSAVVRLMLGAGLQQGQVPRLRSWE
jgi:hypothetical protein